MDGLLKAVVESNQDPNQLLRLRVKLPGAAESVWALPCLPADSRALPDIGTTVWVTAAGESAGQLVWLGVLPQRVP